VEQRKPAGASAKESSSQLMNGINEHGCTLEIPLMNLAMVLQNADIQRRGMYEYTSNDKDIELRAQSSFHFRFFPLIVCTFAMDNIFIQLHGMPTIGN